MSQDIDKHQEALERYKKIARENRLNLLKKKSSQKLGKWQKLLSGGFTPGGTPVYVCGNCGGSEHLYGIEYRKRKMKCEECGSINSYPWEETIEEDGGWIQI